MRKFDATCFVGSWPFYELEMQTLGDLRALHEKRGITGGLVSSLNSIFYNDPMQSEEALAKALLGQDAYRQVSVVNPMLPAWKYTLPQFAKAHPIAGVRVVPGIHGYSLTCPEMQELADFLTREGLPLFISARMEDYRSTYLIVPQDIPMDEMIGFIEKKPKLTVVVSTAYPNEMEALRDTLLSRENVWVDSSYIRGALFMAESLHGMDITEKMVFGSAACMMCFESALQILETAQIPAETIEAIFSQNIEKVLK